MFATSALYMGWLRAESNDRRTDSNKDAVGSNAAFGLSDSTNLMGALVDQAEMYRQ